MDRGMWQLVKPLVEKKDSTGIRHRDTALLEAIKQRQWDSVDYCQLYDADIDIKNEYGETPLNREARKKEWKAVDEIVVRGADPNLFDMVGCSVINGAIHHKQWDTGKILIEYLANIHTPAPVTTLFEPPQTPLQLLINERQGELIHHTLM
jgi:ankyrin repeat protein